MTAVSSAYAQRLLMTLFLVSFGLYLFLATVTYTPFDPGWMHISSDTQQVSNASGVAGAWIADLFFGFLGWSSILIPIFLFMEALQVWWPRSFLSRPFRYAAQFFLILCTASLLYLFWKVPADTLENASGGIVGYEIGKSLFQNLTIYGATFFLVMLWILLFTLAFAVKWHKTWVTLKATPAYLQDLFYRNVPESESAFDLTTSIKKQDDDSNLPGSVIEPPPLLPSSEAAPAKKIFSGLPKIDKVTERLFRDMRNKDHAFEEKNTADKEVIAAPKKSEPTIEVATPELVIPSSDEQVITNVIETEQKKVERPRKEAWRIFSSEPKRDSQQDIDALLKAAEDKSQNNEQDIEHVVTIAEFSAMSAEQKIALMTASEQKPVQSTSLVEPPSIPAVQDSVSILAAPLVEAQIIPPQTVTKPDVLSPQDFMQAWQNLAAKPTDLDEPLTDATGRPVSRAMQVVERRRHLSPLPGLDLLDAVDQQKKLSFSPEQLTRLSELLEIKLQEFNVKAKVVEAQPGPVVTRFELDLAPGVKAAKVTNISRDLARSMSMASVRVVEVIPGKPYIGIEIPNANREIVRLIELLKAPAFEDPNSMISMAMGKDISGNPVIAELGKAPHMLVAGTTGSGKSVAVNSMLLSMLLKYKPDQLRLILIDPKQLELANYNDIPHLLTPVVTDMKDALNALNWCVNEMERRYKLMSSLKVRKLSDYNRKIEEAIMRGEDLIDPTWKPSDSAVQERAPRLQSLPSIVIVADEFADMMMQVGKKAEEMITRLAQKSRAAGIHLLLATQRPSVDVITGLIKANIPTRVALRVNSKIDSRTILDGGGAEDLLGHGDMLFLGSGKIEPERVHGAFISDDEVNRVCDAWRERGEANYVAEILTPYDEEPTSRQSDDHEGSAMSDRDVLYDQCVAYVLETRKSSASSLQRKFSVGYNRAARIIDQMEEDGILSELGTNGKREILI